MNTKKMLAGVCAGAMALSLSAPAFAAAIDNATAVDFTGKPAEGEIAVVMQTGKSNLYVNPYGLPYTLGFGEVHATAGATTFDKTKDIAIQEPSTSTEGFFSDTAVIQNNGDIALNVNVTMTTTEKGKAKVVLEASKPAAGNVTAQYMYGNLEIAPATIGTGTATVTKTAETSAGAGDAVKEEQTDVTIVTPNWKDKKVVAIPAGSGTAGTAGTPSAVADTTIDLPAAKTETDSFGASTTTPGVIAYRLAGTTIPMDTESSGGADDVTPWDAGDVADVTVAFTFTPVVASSNP